MSRSLRPTSACACLNTHARMHAGRCRTTNTHAHVSFSLQGVLWVGRVGMPLEFVQETTPAYDREVGIPRHAVENESRATECGCRRLTNQGFPLDLSVIFLSSFFPLHSILLCTRRPSPMAVKRSDSSPTLTPTPTPTPTRH